MKKQSKIKFKPSFYANLDKLCEYIKRTTSGLKKAKLNGFTYGSCNTGYHLRYLKPENIATFLDNLIRALNMRLIESTYADINQFTTASIIRFLDENGCPRINDHTVNTTPMYVNIKAQTPSDLISFIEGEMIKTSIYSYDQIVKRVDLIQDDLSILENQNFVNVTKRIVDELPHIIETKGHMSMLLAHSTSGVCLDAVEQFILFAVTLHALTLKGMWCYIFPRKILGIPKHDTVRTDNMFVESALLRVDPNMLSLTNGQSMLKTNMITSKERLPIDVNLKNIVLLDQTRGFEEMVSAITFIMTDTRSPIFHLIVKHSSDFEYHEKKILIAGEYQSDVHMITKMFLKFDKTNWNDMDKPFETDKNWLSLIVSGNDFIDHNYRRDSVTNHANTNPILNTLDMLYRVYGERSESNEDLIKNIIKVANIMVAIAREYDIRHIQNRPLVKDILLVLSEILTRNILCIYWNNNSVVELGMRIDDTPVADFLYTDNDITQEMMLLMEDGETKPTPSKNKNAGVTVTVGKNGINKTGDKLKLWINNFREWVSGTLSKTLDLFNKKCLADITLVKNNEGTLNREIEDAISGGIFQPEISSFGIYDVPYSDIKMIANNIVSTIRTLKDGTDEINPEAIQSQLLPKNLSMKDITDSKHDAVKNYILFGNTEGQKEQTLILTGPEGAQKWRRNIIDNILTSQKAIGELSNILTSQLKEVSNMLGHEIKMESVLDIVTANERIFQENPQMPSVEVNTNQSDQATKENDKSTRAGIIFRQIVMPLTLSFYMPTINTITREYFGNSFSAYKGIVAKYHENKPNNVQQPNTNSTTNTQQQ